MYVIGDVWEFLTFVLLKIANHRALKLGLGIGLGLGGALVIAFVILFLLWRKKQAKKRKIGL
jgi:hypothetical protein